MTSSRNLKGSFPSCVSPLLERRLCGLCPDLDPSLGTVCALWVPALVTRAAGGSGQPDKAPLGMGLASWDVYGEREENPS